MISDSNFEGRVVRAKALNPVVSRLEAFLSTVDQHNSKLKSDIPPTRTELDSHANMAVIGRHSIVFDDTGLRCTVNAFSKSAGKLERVYLLTWRKH